MYNIVRNRNVLTCKTRNMKNNIVTLCLYSMRSTCEYHWVHSTVYANNIHLYIQYSQKDGTLHCLICTTAFGMGIDIPDIEYIILWGASITALSFWQQVGRQTEMVEEQRLYCSGKRCLSFRNLRMIHSER